MVEKVLIFLIVGVSLIVVINYFMKTLGKGECNCSNCKISKCNIGDIRNEN